MATITKVDTTQIEEGFRTVKVEQYGAKTADIIQPFGDDSNPIRNMIAVFTETDTDGNPIVIGYFNKDVAAAEGEKRLYSVDSNGSQKAFMWLKNDGKLQLNGTGDNAVRFTPLEAELMSMIQKMNIELTKIQAGISSAGGSYVKTDINADFSKSKVDNVEFGE